MYKLARNAHDLLMENLLETKRPDLLAKYCLKLFVKVFGIAASRVPNKDLFQCIHFGIAAFAFLF